MRTVVQNLCSKSLPADAELHHRLVAAARDTAPVSGLTHNFYKYPARFSPKLVRAVIELFSEPGDLILDPFMGGGTTLVEALALGRHVIGTDINSLAVFVAEVKTTLLDDRELAAINRWATRLPRRVNMHASSVCFGDWADNGYHRHLNRAETWRLRKAIEQALQSALRLGSPKLQAFGRCVVLRTAQWALDGRKTFPSVDGFRDSLIQHAERMISGARALRAAVEANAAHERTDARCLNRSAVGLENDRQINQRLKPKLILTSPPYPGIHVLYHRWQVDGRKETPAPFWIADQLDGSGEAYYAMGSRKASDLSAYFEQLQAALTSLAHLCVQETTVVQVVAFSNPTWQLPRYLEANRAAGFEEVRLQIMAGERDGRLWRNVPNRKWHAGQLGEIPASREVVLFYRLSR